MCQWVCISVRVILLLPKFLSVNPHSTGLGTALNNKEISNFFYIGGFSLFVWRSKVKWARDRRQTGYSGVRVLCFFSSMSWFLLQASSAHGALGSRVGPPESGFNYVWNRNFALLFKSMRPKSILLILGEFLGLRNAISPPFNVILIDDFTIIG